MNITMEQYINILKIMDEKIMDIDKNIKIYSYLNKTPIKDVEKLDINLLNEWFKKLNIYLSSFDEQEINEFI